MKDFNFFMIYIILKLLVMLENHLNYLQDYIFESFFKKYNTLLLKYIIIESLSPEKENMVKPIRNLLGLKKEQNYTAIKDIRNLFKLKKQKLKELMT